MNSADQHSFADKLVSSNYESSGCKNPVPGTIDSGQYGCESWNGYEKSISDGGTDSFPLDTAVVVASTCRLIAIAIASRRRKFAFVSEHAPHSDYSPLAMDLWWAYNSSVFLHLERFDPVVFIGAIVRLGCHSNASIGTYSAEPPSKACKHSMHRVTKTNLIIPATFESFCKSDAPTYTWRPQAGLVHRIEYVCLPMSIDCRSIQAETILDFDAATTKPDHHAASASATFVTAPRYQKHRPKSFKLDIATVHDPNVVDRFHKTALAAFGPMWPPASTTTQTPPPTSSARSSNCNSSCPRGAREKHLIADDTWMLMLQRQRIHLDRRENSKQLAIARVRNVFANRRHLLPNQRQSPPSKAFSRSLQELKRDRAAQQTSLADAAAAATAAGETGHVYQRIRRLRKKPLPTPTALLQTNGTKVTTSDERATRTQERFAGLLQGVPSTLATLSEKKHYAAITAPRNFTEAVPLVQDLAGLFAHVNPNKAMGPDSLHPHVLQELPRLDGEGLPPIHGEGRYTRTPTGGLARRPPSPNL